MHITAVHTHKVKKNIDLFKLLDRYVPTLGNKTIVAITSKIISLSEGNAFLKKNVHKQQLIEKEADVMLGNQNIAKYVITLKSNVLLPTAGVDDGPEYIIIWPKNPQKSANRIRSYLKNRHKLKDIGVIITDSKTSVLRRGTMGFALAYSGFLGLKNYADNNDEFITKQKRKKLCNHADALAAAAVLAMGEGKEQTPLAIITNPSMVRFVSHNPSRIEREEFYIKPENDLFLPALTTLSRKK